MSHAANFSLRSCRLWLAALLVALLAWQSALPALAETTWALHTQVLPPGEDYLGITYGAGTLVAITRTGHILTSPNGSTWTPQVSGVSQTLIHVRYLNGGFVAVGDGGNILTSPDGKTWTGRTSPATSWLYDVAYGANRYAVVGVNGQLLTSTDGVTWQLKPLSSSRWLSGVAYCGKSFAAVGQDGAVYTSTDGGAWSLSAVTGTSLNSVTCGADGLFVAVGGSGHIYTSRDGQGWQPTPTTTTASLYDVLYANGQYVAVGNDGTLVVSGDAQKWSVVDSSATGTHNNLRGVGLALDKVWVVGNGGVLLTSDAPTSSARVYFIRLDFNVIPDSVLYGVAVGNGVWVAVGASGAVLTSADAVKWTPAPLVSGQPQLNSLAFGGGLFAAVGANGVIVTSPDGKSWTSRQAPTTKSLQFITYGHGMFVAVGDGGLVLTSPDGASWTQRTSPALQPLTSATYCNGKFIAVGYYGSTITSPDGVNWSPVEPATHEELTAITCGGGETLAVGTHGVVLTSTDGANWATHSTGQAGIPAAVVYGHFSFMVTGENGYITMSHDDGKTWEIIGAVPTKGVLGLAFADDRWAGVGVNVAAYVTLDYGTTPPATSVQPQQTPGTGTESGSPTTTPGSGEQTASPTPAPAPTVTIGDLLKSVTAGAASGLTNPATTWDALLTQVQSGLHLSHDDAASQITKLLQAKFSAQPREMSVGELDLLTYALTAQGDAAGAVAAATTRLHATPLERTAYEHLLQLEQVHGQLRPFEVFVQGQPIALTVAPFVQDGHTLVPLRTVGEALGASVQWDGSSQSVTLYRQGVTVHLRVGGMTAAVGSRIVDLDAPARIESGRTMVPLRFISEAFGMRVQYLADWQAIVITDAPLQ